jgi:hypothetical protein
MLVLVGSPLLVGGGCTFGRPIVDEQSRYYPSDGVISCTGTRCSDLPAFELDLPPIHANSACTQDLPTSDLIEAASAGGLLEGRRYVLTSESQLEIDLGRIQVRDACLVLQGPVQVRLGPTSELRRVTVLLGPAAIRDRDAGEPSPSLELPTDAGTSDAGASDAGASAMPTVAAGASNSKPERPVDTGKRATPQLFLGYAVLEGVGLQPLLPEQASGTAQIEFSSCTGCDIELDALTMTQSEVASSRLRATTLSLVGGTFDAVELSFEHGLLAGFVANDMRTLRCDTLSLLGATLAGRATKIGPCNCGQQAPSQDDDGGTLRADAPDAGSIDAGPSDDAGTGAMGSSCPGATISQSTLLGGMVDGPVHAENSSFQSVLFARHAPTSLDLWNGSVKLAVVCEEPMALRLDGSATVACTSCDAAETTSACSLAEPPRMLANACKSLGSEVPVCEPPWPTQMIPTPPMPLPDLKARTIGPPKGGAQPVSP